MSTPISGTTSTGGVQPGSSASQVDAPLLLQTNVEIGNLQDLIDGIKGYLASLDNLAAQSTLTKTTDKGILEKGDLYYNIITTEVQDLKNIGAFLLTQFDQKSQQYTDIQNLLSQLPPASAPISATSVTQLAETAKKFITNALETGVKQPEFWNQMFSMFQDFEGFSQGIITAKSSEYSQLLKNKEAQETAQGPDTVLVIANLRELNDLLAGVSDNTAFNPTYSYLQNTASLIYDNLVKCKDPQDPNLKKLLSYSKTALFDWIQGKSTSSPLKALSLTINDEKITGINYAPLLFKNNQEVTNAYTLATQLKTGKEQSQALRQQYLLNNTSFAPNDIRATTNVLTDTLISYITDVVNGTVAPNKTTLVASDDYYNSTKAVLSSLMAAGTSLLDGLKDESLKTEVNDLFGQLNTLNSNPNIPLNKLNDLSTIAQRYMEISRSLPPGAVEENSVLNPKGPLQADFWQKISNMFNSMSTSSKSIYSDATAKKSAYSDAENNESSLPAAIKELYADLREVNTRITPIYTYTDQHLDTARDDLTALQTKFKNLPKTYVNPEKTYIEDVIKILDPFVQGAASFLDVQKLEDLSNRINDLSPNYTLLIAAQDDLLQTSQLLGSAASASLTASKTAETTPTPPTPPTPPITDDVKTVTTNLAAEINSLLAKAKSAAGASAELDSNNPYHDVFLDQIQKLQNLANFLKANLDSQTYKDLAPSLDKLNTMQGPPILLESLDKLNTITQKLVDASPLLPATAHEPFWRGIDGLCGGLWAFHANNKSTMDIEIGKLQQEQGNKQIQDAIDALHGLVLKFIPAPTASKIRTLVLQEVPAIRAQLEALLPNAASNGLKKFLSDALNTLNGLQGLASVTNSQTALRALATITTNFFPTLIDAENAKKALEDEALKPIGEAQAIAQKLFNQ